MEVLVCDFFKQAFLKIASNKDLKKLVKKRKLTGMPPLGPQSHRDRRDRHTIWILLYSSSKLYSLPKGACQAGSIGDFAKVVKP